jgi:hypothetical protein
MDNTVYASSVLQLMTLEYRLFQELPLDMCGQYISVVNVVQEEEQVAAQQGHSRRLDDQGDADAAGADGADADGADADGADENDADGVDADADGNADDANSATDETQCPANGLYSFEVEYTLPVADEKSAWLATGWTGTGQIVFYSEMNNKDSMVGFCQLKLGTSVTHSTERHFNLPSALVASLAAVGVVAALFLLCVYCTCCRRSYKRPPRNKEYLERDPIEIDRSQSGEMDYQSLNETKPWASTGGKSADSGLIA